MHWLDLKLLKMKITLLPITNHIQVQDHEISTIVVYVLLQHTYS